MCEIEYLGILRKRSVTGDVPGGLSSDVRELRKLGKKLLLAKLGRIIFGCLRTEARVIFEVVVKRQGDLALCLFVSGIGSSVNRLVQPEQVFAKCQPAIRTRHVLELGKRVGMGSVLHLIIPIIASWMLLQRELSQVYELRYCNKGHYGK